MLLGVWGGFVFFLCFFSIFGVFSIIVLMLLCVCRFFKYCFVGCFDKCFGVFLNVGKYFSGCSGAVRCFEWLYWCC